MKNFRIKDLMIVVPPVKEQILENKNMAIHLQHFEFKHQYMNEGCDAVSDCGRCTATSPDCMGGVSDCGDCSRCTATSPDCEGAVSDCGRCTATSPDCEGAVSDCGRCTATSPDCEDAVSDCGRCTATSPDAEFDGINLIKSNGTDRINSNLLMELKASLIEMKVKESKSNFAA